MDFEALVFQVDHKRCRYGMVMRVDGSERATFECVMLHYDTRAGRTAPIGEETLAAMQAAAVKEPPDWAGRSVGLK